jgi:UDP-glucose 4-epimerase
VTHALVTGGAGFIGSRLVRALADRGCRVTVLDNLSVGRADAVDPRARLVEGDVRNQADVTDALAGVDTVFHLAAKVTIRGSFERACEDLDTNVMGTATVFGTIDPTCVRRVVLASSMAVYADAPGPQPITEQHPTRPISPYGVGKLAAEGLADTWLRARGITATVLRYFNTFGPGQAFTPYVGVVTIVATKLWRAETPIVFGDGEQRRDFVHVDDIVAGTMAAAGGPPGTYNLGTGQGTSVNEVAALLIARIAPEAVPAHQPAPPGELRYSIADISNARRALGYEPTRSLASDIDEVIAEIGRRARP